MTRQTACALALCSVLAGAAGAAGAPRGGEAEATAAAVPKGGLGTALFRASGVRDSTGVATAVHCTNAGTSTARLSFEFFDFTGAVDCSIPTITAPPGATRTVATRNTALYFEDGTCAQAPATEQGSVRVDADSSGSQAVFCTIQVLDAANALPSFITTLELYDGSGRLFEQVELFGNGFEA